MNGFEAALYGLVQGITEYLPVSSSAHLVLLPRFLGHEDPGLVFDVFLHLGTLFATLIFFWRDWFELLNPQHLRKNVTSASGVTWVTLVVGTIPGAVSGFLLQHWADDAFRGVGVIVITQIVGGSMLYLADRFARAERPVEAIGFGDAVVVGLFQCLALVPGMSRSGSTMTGARLFGFDRAAAARFSFLLSAPITAGAILYELLKHGHELFAGGTVPTTSLAIAFVTTFVSGMLAIGFLLRVLRKVGFLGFAVYRIALALTVYFVFRPF
ncbi:MAG: undecaprenyl-diphosphatase UppP [Bdellovibrionales bacterium]|nr:undecaprenyl-diphosphatase UppP [Bdellovibrionales bacterium]